jgi:hypothetical protein
VTQRFNAAAIRQNIQGHAACGFQHQSAVAFVQGQSCLWCGMLCGYRESRAVCCTLRVEHRCHVEAHRHQRPAFGAQRGFKTMQGFAAFQGQANALAIEV